MELLRGRGVASSVHFRPLHQLTWMAANAKIGPAGTTNADRAAPRALSLPLHPNLTPADVDRVCDELLASLHR